MGRWVQAVGVERCPSQTSRPGQPISRRKALGKEKGTLSSKTNAQNQALPQVHILKNRKIDQECFLLLLCVMVNFIVWKVQFCFYWSLKKDDIFWRRYSFNFE